jgi:L-alanine-DL-glutamate epimerase-like enolase superfamily enzyme
MHRLARYAAAKGRRLIPYGWVATALSAAATLHVAAVNDNVPFVEYAPPAFYPDAGLRRDVAGPEPALRDGAFEVPAGPGLGISIDRDALEEFAHQKLDGK